jgi:hypothetical protein
MMITSREESVFLRYQPSFTGSEHEGTATKSPVVDNESYPKDRMVTMSIVDRLSSKGRCTRRVVPMWQ